MAWWRRGGSDPAPSRVAAAASPRAPTPVQRAAWEDLPPIRPVLTATEPVAPLDSFTSSLATARNPSFLAPLAHQVDPAGPSGQVDGLASAVVPQTMSGGPELAVATRPAPTRRSQVAAVVQRALAPRVRFSEPDAASTAGPAAVIPTAAPAPDEPLLASRHLEPVEVPAPRSLTAAPDPGELSTLPVVSSPSAPAVSSSTVPAIPTVSRLESSAACSVPAHPDHHHAPDDAGGQGTEESHAAVQRSALDGSVVERPAVQRSAAVDAPPAAPVPAATPEISSPVVAPLLGDTLSDTQVAATGAAESASRGDVSTSANEVDHQRFALPVSGSAAVPPAAALRGAEPASVVQRSATPAVPASLPSPSVDSSTPAQPSALPSYLPAPSPSPAGSVPPQAPSVQRAAGLGAPLISAPAVSTWEGPVAQRSSSDRQRSGGPESLGAMHLQRSTSGSGLGIPVAAQGPTGRGSAASTGTDTAHQANEAQEGPEAPMIGFAELMRVIDEGALSGGAVPSRPDSGQPVQRIPDAEPGSASAGASRPLGLGAPLESAGRSAAGPLSMGMSSAPTVQRQLLMTVGSARPPVVPVFSPEVPTAPTLGTTESTTLQRQQSSAPAPEPSSSSSTSASASIPLGTVSIGAPAPASATELTLPSAMFEFHDRPVESVPAPGVQRAAISETAEPAAELPIHTDDGSAFGAETDHHAAGPTSPLETAPLLGAGPSLPVPNVPIPAPPAVTSVPMASSPVALQRTSTLPPTPQPIQRDSVSSSPSMATQHAGAGFGAPLHSVPASGTDRISSREMSFEQMFAPGAAAIASGAAYSDSPGSVVFRSPDSTDHPLGSTPTLGAGSGDGASVQRFGLPSASSLISGARNAASNYADTARQSVGGLADTARNSAGGYADSARQLAGGYADTARQTVGGYADQARGLAGSAMDTAGGYAERAGDTATGLLEGARGAAGGLADQAGGALADAGSAAEKAVGGAADSAGGAARGLMTAAGDAASGAATAAASAVAGAAAGAAGALPTDLNELARRLFDPMSERFKTELWLDRERAGMITDLRR